MSTWHSYPKVWNLGHGAIKELFLDPVVVQEKVDGSQFSFGLVGDAVVFRSKGAEVIIGSAGMFTEGVDAVLARASLLLPGRVYRGEYLKKPKHNALAYSRIPKDHIVLFDVMVGEELYAPPDVVALEAQRLGFESVPMIDTAMRVDDMATLHQLLDRESFLGGQKIEGLVFKNYRRYGVDGKCLFGKHVSEAFRETHKESWKAANPHKADIVAGLVQALRSERRWEKAVERRRDNGLLQDAPQDIGPLLVDIANDIEVECTEEIKTALFNWAFPQIKRQAAAGFPQWYKERLARIQFGSGE